MKRNKVLLGAVLKSSDRFSYNGYLFLDKKHPLIQEVIQKESWNIDIPFNGGITYISQNGINLPYCFRKVKDNFLIENTSYNIVYNNTDRKTLNDMIVIGWDSDLSKNSCWVQKPEERLTGLTKKEASSMILDQIKAFDEKYSEITT